MASSATTISNPNPDSANKGDKCIICGENASEKILKDENFIKMMSFYWSGIEIDVKPKHNKEFDLCPECFYSLKQFYETNDILMYFEQNLNSLRNRILAQNLKGITKRQEENMPLLDIHNDIQKKWGTHLDLLKGSSSVKGYKVDTYTVPDKPGEENYSSATQKTSQAGTSGTASQPTTSKAKEVTSAVQGKEKKTSKVRKSRRKKAKRSVWSSSTSTEEKSTDELSDDSF